MSPKAYKASFVYSFDTPDYPDAVFRISANSLADAHEQAQEIHEKFGLILWRLDELEGATK